MNILLILGISSFVNPIRIKNETIKKELPILVVVTLGFVILVLDSLFSSTQSNVLSRNDGIILLLLFSLFLYYIISIIRKRRDRT